MQPKRKILFSELQNGDVWMPAHVSEGLYPCTSNQQGAYRNTDQVAGKYSRVIVAVNELKMFECFHSIFWAI